MGAVRSPQTLPGQDPGPSVRQNCSKVPVWTLLCLLQQQNRDHCTLQESYEWLCSDNDPTKYPLHPLQCVAICRTPWLRCFATRKRGQQPPWVWWNCLHASSYKRLSTVSMCELFWEVKCNPHQLLSARMPVAIFCALHAFCTISMVYRVLVSFVFADLLELALWATSESCEVSASFGPLLFFQQHHIHRPLWNTLQTCITWNLESMPCIASATPLTNITFMQMWQYAPTWWETF